MSQMRWAGVCLPISLFWFAWTSYASVHWIMPSVMFCLHAFSGLTHVSRILASVLWGWSFYTAILATYMYVEDSCVFWSMHLQSQLKVLAYRYKVYSASALAGLGLVRNAAGAGFPLFAAQYVLRLLSA